MDACGNRFAITRSRPQAYYYALEKGERTRNPKAYNHLPLPAHLSISLGEEPVLTPRTPAEVAAALKTTCDYCRASIAMDSEVAGCIAAEDHLHRPPHFEKLFLRKGLHLRNDDRDIGSPETIQGVDIAVKMCFIPDSLE